MLGSPSTALAGTYVWVYPLAEVGWPAARLVLPPVPPPPPGLPAARKTAKSEIWPAGHPVLAVMFTRTYRAVVALNVIVTVLLLAFGSKVYPAEPAMVEKFEPSVDPSTDKVSVRAPHAVDGGSRRVTWPML